ncbi:MAG: VWA domain-containing protein [Acidobacteria bacterium]|nr:MAG: VWA domain-containing protein [Acidobacteriota bacterium]
MKYDLPSMALDWRPPGWPATQVPQHRESKSKVLFSELASFLAGGGVVRAAESFGTGVRTGEKHAFTNRCLATFFLLMVLPGTARPQETPSQSQSREIIPYTICINVDMVVLHASVRNRKGILVSGLDKDNFQVYEDGVPQQIKYFSHEDIPVTVGLVIDNSGSMRPKRPEVIAAALAFARSSNPEDQMFAVSFNENITFGLPSDTPFTDSGAQLEAALSRSAAAGMTALYDAVAAALEHLKKGNRDKKVLLVVSDGGDNASRRDRAQVMAMAGQPDAIIYTIGLFDRQDPDRNPRVLKQLAKATGGEAFLPQSLADVVPVCERIAHDVRNQYTIVYVPTNGRQDGTYRVIQVNAGAKDRGRLEVRTRAGYYAPLKPPPLPAAGATDHEVQN